MTRRAVPTALVAIALACLAGCDAKSLAAAAAAAAASQAGGQPGAASPATGAGPGGVAQAGPAAGTGSGTAAGNGQAPDPAKPAPASGASQPSQPDQPPPAAKVDAGALTAFKAKVAAAEKDPRATAKLFVAGLVAYEKDKHLGRLMMGHLLTPNLVQSTGEGPEPQGADEIYFRTIERDLRIGRYYLDKVEAGDASDVEAHVVIDEEYKAVDKGVDEAAGTAAFYLHVNHPNNVRSRPLRLKRLDGVWRVSNYSSLMVLP